MTPLWRRYMKELLSSRDSFAISMRDEMARARCFELNGLRPLIYATGQELRGAATTRLGRYGSKHIVDLGVHGLLPASPLWVEMGEAGILVSDDGSGNHLLWARVEYRDLEDDSVAPQQGALGMLQLNDGEARFSRQAGMPESFPGDGQAPETDVGVTLGFMLLAAIAMINSPAARAEAVESHRGLARDINRAVPGFVDRRIVHTKVTIQFGHTRDGAEGERRPSSHPKAYHFCRAHIRRLQGGSITRVRAHWRGDLAFGYRLPSYTLRGGCGPAGGGTDE